MLCWSSLVGTLGQVDSCCPGSLTRTVSVSCFTLQRAFLWREFWERDAYCICTHMSLHMHVSHSKSARIAFLSQLAAVCQECADVHINTYWLTNASTSTLLQLFNMLENAFEATRLCALNHGGVFVFPTGAAFSRSNVHILSCIPRNDLGVTS